LANLALSSYSRKKIKNFYTGFCEQIGGAREHLFIVFRRFMAQLFSETEVTGKEQY